MKKIFALLILSLLLIGCAKESAEPIVVDRPTETGPEDVKVVEQPAMEDEETAEPAMAEEAVMQMSPKISEIIKKSDKVKSMEYSLSKYIGDEQSKFAHVYSKGEKMTQEFSITSGTYEKGTLYTRVYLDTNGKTAEAYCEETDGSCEEPNTPISVNYNDFVTETPLDVIDSVKSAEEVSSALYDNKEAIIIQDKHNGKFRKIWLWEYRGLPLRYELYDSLDQKAIVRVEYEGMVINGVKDDELAHQHIDDPLIT